MLITEINNILKILKKDNFSGHIKIGVENHKIVSLNREYNLTSKDFNLKNNDFVKILESLENTLMYGRIEYDIDNGEIVNMSYTITQNGKILTEWLERNKQPCKYVVSVKKK